MKKHLLGMQELLTQQAWAATNTSGFETTNNPTARVTLISPTTRHLIHFGTETTIGTPTTQDDMFIRFSVDET